MKVSSSSSSVMACSRGTMGRNPSARSNQRKLPILVRLIGKTSKWPPHSIKSPGFQVLMYWDMRPSL
uniref:Uncharacterized protein n=1 Tax=Anguilla anguilla TaxID=7936 RepID=A0A0E9R6F1_ANGAN